MHVRNVPEEARGNWATYITAIREALEINKSELARRIDVDRGTVHRWETGANRPEDPAVIVRVAEATGRPVDEVLAAAGLRPDVPPPPLPTRPPDPVLDRIRESGLPDAVKKELIERELVRRARDEQARLEDVELMIRSLER